ncbi:MAG TPA: heavy metal transporter [Clostridiales bacterium]|nr:heavy metal transporter [Clostridiales bacterium]
MERRMITKKMMVEGMTCISCENKIREKLRNTKGIMLAKVSYSTGEIDVAFDQNSISLNQIKDIIQELDYEVVQAKQISKKTNRLSRTIVLLMIIFSVYIILNHFNLLSVFNNFPEAKAGMGYGVLFIIGLLTSVHCIGMCGGINLSQCALQPSISDKDKGRLSIIRSSFLYNSGRVASYTIIGGIVGALGSVVSFSGTARGAVQILAGVFMVIMGLNILNLFPSLRRLNMRMPKIFSSKIMEQKKSNRPLYVGLLNGLMPCGPLQAMQLYALSTGDPLKGALSMMAFSLGTVPLMFGLGAIGSLLTKKFKSGVMTTSAILVVVLGIFMFNSGMGLSGLAITSYADGNSQVSKTTSITDNLQTITTKLSSSSYEPITVQKGIPVKWIIKADEANINGCNNRIVIPKLNQEIRLVPGDNIIEFTPTESGVIPFSCWMGMIRSTITVVDDLDSIEPAASYSPDIPVNTTLNDFQVSTDKVAISIIEDGRQYVETSMDDVKLEPVLIIMQRGLETIWTINKTEGDGSLMFFLYNARIDVKEGENQIRFTPSIDFEFSVIDTNSYGFVKVVDDISSIDIDAIRLEIQNHVLDIPIEGSEEQSCH